MDKNSPPPIDTTKIQIEIKELDPPDYQLDFVMPPELVKKIHETLKEGGFDYEDKQMVPLLTKICLDEGMYRLDKKSIWGPKLMKGTNPGTFSTEASFTFSSVVDASPIDAMPQIDAIPINRLNMDVTEELINAELRNQQLEFGAREESSGPLDYGDEIICTATLSVDGEDEPEFIMKDCHIRVPREGETTVLGAFQFDDMGEQLRGTQLDGTTSIQVTIPNTFPNITTRGKPATVEIEVDRVERITPASLDEVLKQYGTPNETILRTQIRLSLKQNFQRENDYLMLKQLFAYLEKTIDLPISKRVIDDRFAELCKAELGKDTNEKLSEEAKEALMQRAVSITKRRVITACLSETLDIKVSEEDVEKQIRAIAESRRQRPEDVRSEFVSNDRMHILANMSMEKKIFQGLQDKMEFTEIK